jgi:hypothetical protein
MCGLQTRLAQSADLRQDHLAGIAVMAHRVALSQAWVWAAGSGGRYDIGHHRRTVRPGSKDAG